MIAKYISLDTVLYQVSSDSIQGDKPLKIERTSQGINIKIREYGDTFFVEEKATVIERPYKYFLNFNDAQKEQKRLRLEAIRKAYERKVEADKAYNALIEKYFDKPLTRKNEIK